jgi:hypothetical protein
MAGKLLSGKKTATSFKLCARSISLVMNASYSDIRSQMVNATLFVLR